MNRGAWQAAVQNWTRPKQLSMHTCVHMRTRARTHTHTHTRACVIGGGGGEAKARNKKSTIGKTQQ